MSHPRLCLTVTAPTTAELRRRRDAAAGADLVELRLDSVRDPDVAGALEGRRGPVIVTCRPTWEGGHFEGAEEDRLRILRDALDLGAEYVDVEFRAGANGLLARTHGTRVIVSSHNFDGIPADLPGLLRDMRQTGAEVAKIAVKTTCLSDLVPLLDVAAAERETDRLVLIGMGDFGVATRVLPGRFASAWTYTGAEQHVGQLSPRALLDDYHFRQLTGATDIYGIVGLPVSHSVSPAMHNAAFAAAGLNAVYLPLPAVSADDVLTFGRAMGVKGLSVTIPHKVTLLGCMDDVSDTVQRVGALNTVRVTDGRWAGENTDSAGFLAPLVERVPLNGLRAAVLGSGGSARAAVSALAASGCTVRVHARSRVNADAIAAIGGGTSGAFPPEPGSWDLLVNCTPVGMYPHVDETPIPAAHLTGRYVYDLVYNPPQTRLLVDAAKAGCQTIGGLDMLVAQAREQFRWWTGVAPSVEVMRAAALRRLAEFQQP